MALEGFTSASTGEQLFTLTGSVEGSLTGLLEITGTDLDLIDGITVTGTQYAAVEIGDLVNTGDAISAPISITSTANGGFTLQIGEAVVTVSVTYVQPSANLTGAILNGAVLTRSSGNLWSNSYDASKEDIKYDLGKSLTYALQLQGSRLGLIEVSNVSFVAVLQEASENKWQTSGAVYTDGSQSDSNRYFAVDFVFDATESQVDSANVLIAEFDIDGVSINGYVSNFFYIRMEYS